MARIVTWSPPTFTNEAGFVIEGLNPNCSAGVQVNVFDKAAEMFSGDSCKMARLIGSKSCAEVQARLQKVACLSLSLGFPQTNCFPGQSSLDFLWLPEGLLCGH